MLHVGFSRYALTCHALCEVVLGNAGLDSPEAHCSLFQTRYAHTIRNVDQFETTDVHLVAGSSAEQRAYSLWDNKLPVSFKNDSRRKKMRKGNSLMQTKSFVVTKSNSTTQDSDLDQLGIESRVFQKPKESAEKKHWTDRARRHFRTKRKKWTKWALNNRKQAKLIALGSIASLVCAVIVWSFCCGGREKEDDWDRMDLNEQFHKKKSNLHKPESKDCTDEISPSFQVFGRQVDCEPQCDYVLVLPLSGSEGTNIHQTGSSIRILKWDSIVEGIKLAKAVFDDPNKAHLITKHEIKQRFTQEMTYEAYHAEVRRALIDILIGPAFGLNVAVCPSVDHDEIFIRLSVPKDEGTIHQFAQSLSYPMPLSDVAYERIQEVPSTFKGETRRAVAPFLADHAECYQPFRHIDRMRLLKAQLDKHLDLDELESQGVLVGHFMPHTYQAVMAMSKNWANPWRFYQISSHHFDDHIRNYFGEEVAWMFIWQTYFTRALVFPCLIAVVVYLRRFFFDIVKQREIQLGATVLMMMWCTLFNVFYDRRESRLQQRWGTDDNGPGLSVRNEYDPALNKTFLVKWAPFIGDFLAMSAIGLAVGGTLAIQSWREGMMEKHKHWIWPQAAALMVTAQIFAIDKVWRSISRVIVNCENHRLHEKWERSWVQKLFVVRIFNNLYPFLYVGFMKKYSSVGCPPTEDGCLGELEMNLLTYFAVRLVAQFAGDFMLFAMVRIQVIHELLKRETTGSSYTYLQVQAKQYPYDDEMRMDDWTEQVLTFTFVASFNVVLPAISVVALLTNLLEGRMVAHRNATYLRRPQAKFANGIGGWRDVLFGVEMLAVIINLGFAIFDMRPLRDYDRITKWLIFVIAEHIIVAVKLAVRAKFPPTPVDVEEISEKNRHIVHRLFVDLERHSVNAKVVHTQAPDIGPKAFGGRGHVDIPA